jgi:outer membrane autotransporter protein
MKNISIILFSVLFILLFNPNVHAQLFKIGAGGGLTNISSPDSYTDDVSEGGNGFSSEFNYGVIAKLGLPIIPLTPRGFVLFHNLNGSGTPPTSTADVEISRTITTAGLGLQYGFIPIPAGFDPYLSLDVTFNNFGDFTIKTGGMEEKSEGGSRGGLQVGVGTEVTIIPLLNFDIFAGYNWLNLTGKEEGEETVTAFILDVFLIFNFL